MPYQNWELHGKGLNYTELVIEGAVTSITVKIEVSISSVLVVYVY